MLKRHKNTKCWINVELTKVNVDLTQVDVESTKVNVDLAQVDNKSTKVDIESMVSQSRVNKGSTNVNNESMISLLAEKNTVPIYLSLA